MGSIKKENQPRNRKKINQVKERKINLHPAFPLLKQILECKRTLFLHLPLNIDFINILSIVYLVKTQVLLAVIY